jgi:hypothetical protein
MKRSPTQAGSCLWLASTTQCNPDFCTATWLQPLWRHALYFRNASSMRKFAFRKGRTGCLRSHMALHQGALSTQDAH